MLSNDQATHSNPLTWRCFVVNHHRRHYRKCERWRHRSLISVNRFKSHLCWTECWKLKTHLSDVPKVRQVTTPCNSSSSSIANSNIRSMYWCQYTCQFISLCATHQNPFRLINSPFFQFVRKMADVTLHSLTHSRTQFALRFSCHIHRASSSHVARISGAGFGSKKKKKIRTKSETKAKT